MFVHSKKKNGGLIGEQLLIVVDPNEQCN